MGRQNELNAEIEYARLSLRASGSADIPTKVGCDGSFYIANAIFEIPDIELPVLSFPETLLSLDGFLAAKILNHLRKTKGELWFIFGTFKNQNGKRCYVTLPARNVPELFLINDWSLLEWTGRKIHQI